MNINLRYLIPIFGVVLIVLSQNISIPHSNDPKIVITDTPEFGGPIDWTIGKIVGALGGDVEDLRIQLPRSQKIHRAVNSAAEAFAKSMNSNLKETDQCTTSTNAVVAAEPPVAKTYRTRRHLLRWKRN